MQPRNGRLAVAEPKNGQPESDRIEGALHPRETPEVFGHLNAIAAFAAARRSARLAHGFILDGPRGVGKATLAYSFARQLLRNGKEDGAADRLITEGSHPDLLALKRPYDHKTKRLKTVLTVDEVRRIIPFFGATAALGGYRVVIVDAADDMNAGAANALLKSLEEPPSRAVLFLIAHNSGRLLPTLHSRCVSLTLDPLSDDDVHKALAAQPSLQSADVAVKAFALRHAAGSAGRAMAMLNGPAAALIDLEKLLDRLPDIDFGKLQALAARLGGGRVLADFQMGADLIETWIEKRLRAEASTAPAASGALARLAEVWENTRARNSATESLNLDREQALFATVVELADALSSPRRPLVSTR